MDKYSDPEIGNLLKDKDNNICFDCGTPNPKWASVNNSVFVCLRCAGVHRGLGVNFSFIRSLTMDNWDIKQIKLLTLGGNKRLRMIMEEFGIPANIEIESKYRLKGFDYYRKLLRAEAFDDPFPSKPDKVVAFEVIDSGLKKVNNNQIETTVGIQPDPDEQNQIISEPEEQNNDLFSKVEKFIQNKATVIQKNIQDLKIKEKASGIGKKANDFGKKAAVVLEEKTTIVVNSLHSFLKKTGAYFGKKDDTNDQDVPEGQISNSSTDGQNQNQNDGNIISDKLSFNDNPSQLNEQQPPKL